MYVCVGVLTVELGKCVGKIVNLQTEQVAYIASAAVRTRW